MQGGGQRARDVRRRDTADTGERVGQERAVTASGLEETAARAGERPVGQERDESGGGRHEPVAAASVHAQRLGVVGQDLVERPRLPGGGIARAKMLGDAVEGRVVPVADAAVGEEPAHVRGRQAGALRDPQAARVVAAIPRGPPRHRLSIARDACSVGWGREGPHE